MEMKAFNSSQNILFIKKIYAIFKVAVIPMFFPLPGTIEIPLIW